MIRRILVQSSAVLAASCAFVWAQSADDSTVSPTEDAEVSQAALSEEEAAWNALGADATARDLFAFLDAYPDGERSADARRRLLDVLDTTNNAANSAEQVTTDETDVTEGSASEEATSEPTQAETVMADGAATDDNIEVFFDQPLEQGDIGVIGETLEKLIKGSPLHPPVEGLPEEYWKTEQCSSCHEWQRANLCEQANFYLREDGAENLTKKHPYGGSFKLNLRRWATGGCQ